MWRGSKASQANKELQECDYDDMPSYLYSARLAQAETDKHSSVVAMLKSRFLKEYMSLGLMILVYIHFGICQGWLMATFVDYLGHAEDFGPLYGYVLALSIGLCSTGIWILHHQYYFRIGILGLKIRLTLMTAIYQKALRLDLGTMSGQTSGQLVNLLSNDAFKHESGLHFHHYLWAAPVQLLEALLVLWYLGIGRAALIGFSSLAILVPVMVCKFCTNRRSHMPEPPYRAH
jgi:hypothetical protein